MKIIHQVTPEMVYDLFVSLVTSIYYYRDDLLKNIEKNIINMLEKNGTCMINIKNLSKISPENLKQFYIELLKIE